MKRLAMLCLIVVAGCGTAVRTGALPAARLAVSGDTRKTPAAAHGFVFTCHNGTSYECPVYDAAGRLLRTKKKALVDPQGVAAGSDGLLYVANEGAKNILVYGAGARTLLRSLDDGGNVPVDVAVFGQTVAASNLHSVTVFRSGATQPSRTLKDAEAFQGSGVAFDPSGNCYWSFTNEQLDAQIDEFVHCKGEPIVVPITEGAPTGLAFDASGNLWYTSVSTQKPGVYRCNGTRRCGIVYSQFENPVYINFSHDFRDLWVDDPGSVALYEIDVASGAVVQKITGGLTFDNPPSGVAAAPGPL